MASDCRSLARFTLRGIPPMPAGHARLEVRFEVDENGLLRVQAKELTTGITQHVEVTPSYGLDEEQIERMLLDALDHGEEDLTQRRLTEARVEGARLVQATRKALDDDGAMLEPEERERVLRALGDLERSLESATTPGTIQLRIDELDQATNAWAGRRMNRAIAQALEGKAVTGVEQRVQHARGVDAHVAEHSGQSSEPQTLGEPGDSR